MNRRDADFGALHSKTGRADALALFRRELVDGAAVAAPHHEGPPVFGRTQRVIAVFRRDLRRGDARLLEERTDLIRCCENFPPIETLIEIGANFTYGIPERRVARLEG